MFIVFLVTLIVSWYSCILSIVLLFHAFTDNDFFLNNTRECDKLWKHYRMNPVKFSWQTAKSFSANLSKLVIKKTCGQDLSHFLDTPKNISVKTFPQVVICDGCATWHDLYTVISIHIFQISTRNSQKLGSKLASR